MGVFWGVITWIRARIVDPLGGAIQLAISALEKRQKIGPKTTKWTPHPSIKCRFLTTTNHVIFIYSLKSLDN